MALTEGCVVMYGTYTFKVKCHWNEKQLRHGDISFTRLISEKGKVHDINTNTLKATYEIIGHPIQGFDWLAVLEEHIEEIFVCDGVAKVQIGTERDEEGVTFTRIFFSLETGQPNSPADYKAFNKITQS